MVQFLFLDRADLPEHTLRASNTSQSVTPRGDLITTTTTTYIKAPETQGSVCLSCVGDVSFALDVNNGQEFVCCRVECVEVVLLLCWCQDSAVFNVPYHKLCS